MPNTHQIALPSKPRTGSTTAALHRLVLSGVVCAVVAVTTCLGQGLPNKFVLGSINYASSEQGVLETHDMKTTLGLSLGYLYAANRNIIFGASGHWMLFTNGNTYDCMDPSCIAGTGPTNSLTILQMMAQVRLRAIKHGFTPYLDLEGGMCYVSHVDVVLPCLAAGVGVQIPVSSRLDLDLRIRTSWAPQANAEVLVTGLHLGVVYALPRD